MTKGGISIICFHSWRLQLFAAIFWTFFLSSSSFITTHGGDRRIIISQPGLFDTSLNASKKTLPSPSNAGRQKKKKKARKGERRLTIAELREELISNPALLDNTKSQKKKKGRSRRRADSPQQSYVYAAQRKGERLKKASEDEDGDTDETEVTQKQDENSPIVQARKLGLINAAAQHCDALIDDVEPILMGRIRVSDETGSGAYAYIIDKPAGWSIVGGAGGGKNTRSPNPKSSQDSRAKSEKNKPVNRLSVKIKDGPAPDTLEFEMNDVLAAMTPEERTEFEAQGGELFGRSGGSRHRSFKSTKKHIPGFDAVELMTPEEREEACIEEEDYDPNDILDFNEEDVLALMTPEERLELDLGSTKPDIPSEKDTGGQDVDEKELSAETIENLRRIRARQEANAGVSLNSSTRPSVVSWLKDLKASEGSPIRGGNYWKAIAGATNVDDSGLVCLFPKSGNVENIFCDYAEYVAVVGNGKVMATTKSKKAKEVALPTGAVVDMEIVSKVRRGRADDPVHTVRISIPECLSTSSSIVSRIQEQFEDGVRGDANPLDRRATRRLIHCSALSVSSLLYDDHVLAEGDGLPDDITIFSDRLNNRNFVDGSFLGRTSLRQNPLTNAYREINSSADGFPGWTVDRYGAWLLVQHDEKASSYRGPLPSIHDGNTAGVYYLPWNRDRSAMGSSADARPTLLEGQRAPEIIPILENGITYHASLADLSTGIFLDQRLHRAWLARNCNENTRVLNCFAHCGAFSIAAATAGASTVSLDLNKKWLDRVQPQLEANGIAFDERHDCIFGDCFEWLEKLGKRGEKYDVSASRVLHGLIHSPLVLFLSHL